MRCLQQTVTQEFRQHCVKITHILYSRNSIMVDK